MNKMRKFMIALVPVAGLLLVACGGAQPAQDQASVAEEAVVEEAVVEEEVVEEAVFEEVVAEEAVADVALSETYVIADFGYSIDLPAGWQGETRSPTTILNELDEDHQRAFDDSYDSKGISLSLDHRGMAFMRGIGLTAEEPSLEDLLELNQGFFNWQEPFDVSEATLFDEPALVVKAQGDEGFGVNYMGFKDDEAFLFSFAAPTDEAREAFLATWNQMVESIEPVEE